MLQSMRSSAKYIWIFLVIFFVGGFLLAETSGLLGRAPVTTSICRRQGQRRRDSRHHLVQRDADSSSSRQRNRPAAAYHSTIARHLQDQAFEQLVSDALLRQEYKRRGITVTDEEIADAARTSPPPQLLQSPELQTDGHFDPDKYQRFLASPAARQEGLLFQLEAYYRDAIPREKLFEQVASDVFLSDARLWRTWKDTHDSAQVSYAAFRPEMLPDSAVTVPRSEIAAYYDKNKKDFE